MTAKLFRNGKSQAVRLPKEFRFDGDRVIVKRVGDAIVLLPYRAPWKTMLDSLALFSPDYMTDRDQPPQQRRANPFK